LIVEDEQKRNVPLPMRSLPELEQHQEARAEAGRSWHQFTTTRDGDAGVAGAMSGLALKSADAAAPATLGAEAQFARRYGLNRSSSAVPGQIDSAPLQVEQYSQGSRFVGGKNFFQNGSQWVDTAVQKMPNATPVRLQFASPEYFEFVARNPAAAPWLALGGNVRFVLKDTIYEVYE
jgi:hypothetical protein